MNMRSQVIVLGMHRSGTSLIASILHLSGISMGKEFLRPDNGNPGGYFEDLEFLNLNKTILTQAEGTWRKPPSKERISISGSKNINILYLQRIEEFKDKISPQFVHVVTYENLLNNKLAPIEVEKLVTFAHSRPRTKVDAWLRLINPNK